MEGAIQIPLPIRIKSIFTSLLLTLHAIDHLATRFKSWQIEAALPKQIELAIKTRVRVRVRESFGRSFALQKHYIRVEL